MVDPETSHTPWPRLKTHKCPRPLPSFAAAASFLGAPFPGHPVKVCASQNPQVPPWPQSKEGSCAGGRLLRVSLATFHLFACPGGPGSHAPAPCRAQPATQLTRLWRPQRVHSLEPHTDEGAELDIHLCVCSVVGHVHGLHSLRGHSRHSGAPQLPARKAGPTHGPAYPVEQLLWGQNFAIFIQPGEGGGPELPVLPGVQAWAAPSPPTRLPGQGTGPVTCTSYTAPGANTPSQSLSPPPGLLPGGWGECQGQGDRSQVKATGAKCTLHHPASSCRQLRRTQARGEKDSGGHGSSQRLTSSINSQGWQAPPSRDGFFSPCSNRALRAGQRVPRTRSVTASVTASSPATEY